MEPPKIFPGRGHRVSFLVIFVVTVEERAHDLEHIINLSTEAVCIQCKYLICSLIHWRQTQPLLQSNRGGVWRLS